MKELIFISKIMLLSIFFTGCELNEIFGPSKKEIELKERTLALKEQEIKFNQLLKQKDLESSLALKKSELEQKQLINLKQSEAKIANEKAVLDSNKEIELSKINSTLEKAKLKIEEQKVLIQNKEKELKYELAKQKEDNSSTTQKYIIIFGSVLIIILSFALFTYYNNRRKDKLRAYEDNLNKYFRDKENQAKIEIASKVLDTIASGKLNTEQENRLITSLGSDSNNRSNQKTLSHENSL